LTADVIKAHFYESFQGDRGGAGASVDENNAWTLQGLIAGGPISCDFSEKVI